MTRLAVQSRLLPGSSLREKYETALAYGFDGMELSHFPMVEAAREALRDGVPVTAMCSGPRGWFIDPDPAQLAACGLTHDDGVDVAQMGPICLNAVAHAGRLHEGQPVVVFGAGVVGLITARLCRSLGAADVHVVDRLAGRLAIASSLGLRTVDAAGERDVAYELKRQVGADAIPVAFECTGSTAALNEAIRTVRRRGLVVAIGFYQGEASGLYLGDEFHHNAVRLTCAQIGNVHPGWNIGRLRTRIAEMAQAGDLVLGGLPRLTLPVERAAEGFAALARPGQVLQIALEYGA